MSVLPAAEAAALRHRGDGVRHRPHERPPRRHHRVGEGRERPSPSGRSTWTTCAPTGSRHRPDRVRYPSNSAPRTRHDRDPFPPPPSTRRAPSPASAASSGASSRATSTKSPAVPPTRGRPPAPTRRSPWPPARGRCAGRSTRAARRGVRPPGDPVGVVAVATLRAAATRCGSRRPAPRAPQVEAGGMDNAPMPTILVDPRPRTLDAIFDAPTRARLDALGDVVVHDRRGSMPGAVVEAHLAETVAIVGQTDLDADRLSARAGVARNHQCRDRFPAERRL